MLKKDATLTPNRVSLGLKCGDCTHFCKGPAKFEKLCNQLGFTSFSDACPEFSPDLTKLVQADQSIFEKLQIIARDLSQTQTRLLAFVFRNIDFIKKAGFEFGQEVVFSISGKEYLDQYVRGRVLSADRTGETIYIVSNLENLNKVNAYLSLLRPQVLTVDEFKKKRSVLVREGRIAEPKPRVGSNKRSLLQCLKMSPEQYELHLAKLNSSPEEYKPPQLDLVPSDWIDQRSVESLLDSKRSVKKSKGKKDEGKAKSKSSKSESTSGVFKIERYNRKTTAKR